VLRRTQPKGRGGAKLTASEMRQHYTSCALRPKKR